jgi:hypothetical protein
MEINKNNGDETFINFPLRKEGIKSENALHSERCKIINEAFYDKRKKLYNSAPKTFTYDKVTDASKQLLALYAKNKSGTVQKEEIPPPETSSQFLNRNSGAPDRFVTTSYSESLDNIIQNQSLKLKENRLAAVAEEISRPTSPEISQNGGFYVPKELREDVINEVMFASMNFIQYESKDILYEAKGKVPKLV